MSNGALLLILAGSAALIVLGIICPEPRECQTYNEMRQIHIETNGEYGWPKGAIRECEYES